MIPSLLAPSSTQSSTSSPVEKLPDASDRRVRCTATVVFWTPFHTSPPVRDTGSVILHAFNRSAPKCSQIHFRKDRRGTSTRSYPPTATLMPSITTTSPTATLKMDSLAPKRKRKNLSKANATHSRGSRMPRTQKRPKLLSPISCRQQKQVKPTIATGQPHLSLIVPPFTPIAGPTIILQEPVKSPSSVIWRP